MLSVIDRCTSFCAFMVIAYGIRLRDNSSIALVGGSSSGNKRMLHNILYTANLLSSISAYGLQERCYRYTYIHALNSRENEM